MVVNGTADKARALTWQLDRTLRAINRRGCGKAKVSTMTVTARLNTSKVCRESLAIALSLVDGDGALSATKKRTNKKSCKRKPRAEFYNQITMYHGTKSLKIFRNGRMHVTGCASPMQFLDVASAACKMIQDTAGVIAEDGGNVGVVDFNIEMINLNFEAPTPLFLQELNRTCASMGYTASYDADTYPGLNVKIPAGDRHVTALLFKSGKVIITGAKTPEELDAAHCKIVELLGATADKK